LIRRKEPAWQPSLSAALPFLIIGSFSASLAGHAVSSKLAGGIVQTEPWYTAAAIPMLLLIAVGGASSLSVAKSNKATVCYFAARLSCNRGLGSMFRDAEGLHADPRG